MGLHLKATRQIRAGQPQFEPQDLDDTQIVSAPQRLADDVLALQRSAGNQAVSRLLGGAVGQPLSPSLRQEMESRFDHDFSGVRVHTDAAATASARDLDANAYTWRHHIVFGEGQFAPETFDGRRLLAHELGHVIQQARATSGPQSAVVAEATGPEEAEASRAASTVADGGRPPAPAGIGTGVQRDVGWARRGADPYRPHEVPDIDYLPIERYVDSYHHVLYNAGYRSEAGRLSTWLVVVDDAGSSIDINFDAIDDNVWPGMASLPSPDHLGEGGRVFPFTMGRVTTPRLWAAKQEARKIMDDYNALMILGTFPTWWSLMPVGPVRFGPGIGTPRVVRHQLPKSGLKSPSGGQVPHEPSVPTEPQGPAYQQQPLLEPGGPGLQSAPRSAGPSSSAPEVGGDGLGGGSRGGGGQPLAAGGPTQVQEVGTQRAAPPPSVLRKPPAGKGGISTYSVSSGPGSTEPGSETSTSLRIRTGSKPSGGAKPSATASPGLATQSTSTTFEAPPSEAPAPVAEPFVQPPAPMTTPSAEAPPPVQAPPSSAPQPVRAPGAPGFGGPLHSTSNLIEHGAEYLNLFKRTPLEHLSVIPRGLQEQPGWPKHRTPFETRQEAWARALELVKEIKGVGGDIEPIGETRREHGDLDARGVVYYFRRKGSTAFLDDKGAHGNIIAIVEHTSDPTQPLHFHVVRPPSAPRP